MNHILFDESDVHKNTVYMWVHTSYNKHVNDIQRTQFLWFGGASNPIVNISEKYKIEFIKNIKSSSDCKKIWNIIQTELKKHTLEKKVDTVQNYCAVILNTLQCIQTHSTIPCLLYTSPSPRD